MRSKRGVSSGKEKKKKRERERERNIQTTSILGCIFAHSKQIPHRAQAVVERVPERWGAL
jgi:hypothetical protein